MNKVHGGADWMRAATQIAQAIEPLDGQRQAGEQPDDQQAVGVMMTHMPQTMAVLGIIKSLVFDFPTALGAKIEHPTADFFLKRIREPEGFDHLTVWFLLPIEQDPHSFPTQTLPGIEVFGIPKFDAVVSIAHDLLVGIAVRTTQWTTPVRAASDRGSIHGQANAAAGFKSLVAFGLAQHACQ